MGASENRTGREALVAQRRELVRMQELLTKMISSIDRQLEKGGEAVAAAKHRSSGDRRPVRVLALDCLEDIGWITYTREIAQYSAAHYGREIASSRFGPLARDEEKSFQAGTQRPVWLAYALTHDRHQPIKRLLGRSDWPLARRIVAPTSGRIQHLKLTARLCELGGEAEDLAVDPEMMRIIAADHARDLPRVEVRRGEFDLELWAGTARRELENLLPKDEEMREESAARLRRRSEFHQLFGVPDVLDLEAVKPPEAAGS